MSLSKPDRNSFITGKSLRELDSLADEVLLMIYNLLEVKDLLNLRKVSVRNARLAMDKKLWKWTRIDLSQRVNELFRDEEYFTGKGRSETPVMNLEGLSGDDLSCQSWLVCRVKEVSEFFSVISGRHTADAC